jgi:ABC-2 type transport system ATP-binding protein
MSAIRTENLTKKYKDITAVNSLNLDVADGELFSLLGINGAGKTTTIKMLCCLTEATSGEAFICGESIRESSSAVRSLIAVSPQETAIAQNLTVRENLELMCGIYRFDKLQSQEKINRLTSELGLDNVASKTAGKLSGGYQRRLSIAMALIGEPKVVFLDEPTLGLDVIARSELWELIRKLKGSMTVVLTTHYMEEAEALSDRVGIMRNGSLVTVGSVEEIKLESEKDNFQDAFIFFAKGDSV